MFGDATSDVVGNYLIAVFLWQSFEFRFASVTEYHSWRRDLIIGNRFLHQFSGLFNISRIGDGKSWLMTRHPNGKLSEGILPSTFFLQKIMVDDATSQNEIVLLQVFSDFVFELSNRLRKIMDGDATS